MRDKGGMCVGGRGCAWQRGMYGGGGGALCRKDGH